MDRDIVKKTTSRQTKSLGHDLLWWRHTQNAKLANPGFSIAGNLVSLVCCLGRCRIRKLPAALSNP